MKLRNILWFGACALLVVVASRGDAQVGIPPSGQLSDVFARYITIDSDEDGVPTWIWSGFGDPSASGDTDGTIVIAEDESPGHDLWFATDASGGWSLVFTSSATAVGTTCADTGNGSPCTATVTPEYKRYHEITCNDSDTCDITLGETDVDEGMLVTFVCLSASPNTCDFADTAGVTELAGALLMDQYDSLTLIYAGDRWIEVSRSVN